MILNTGMELDAPVAGERRQRRRQLARRVGVFRLSRGGSREAERAEAAIIEALEAGRPTCVLDLVDGGEAHTLDETGELLNISRERVRQIEVKALIAIRNERSADLLEEAQGLQEPPGALEDAGLV